MRDSKSTTKLATKISYGALDCAGNVLYVFTSTYILYFYTDIAGLSAGIAGVILLLVRIFDSLDAPIWGLIIDRTKSKYGKCRPWFIRLIIPYAIFTILAFYNPNLPPTQKAIYFCVTYLMSSIIFTGISPEIKAGYAYFTKTWTTGDEINFNMTMEVQQYYSHPLVRSNVDRVAIQRGPFVYCLEGNDNQHYPLHLLKLNKNSQFRVNTDNTLLEGAITLQADGIKEVIDTQVPSSLYSLNPTIQAQSTTLKFIPYFLWANRGENEMLVWIRQQQRDWILVRVR